jgi:hypothetical protein
MTIEQTESYEAYCARREREIFEERLLTSKLQKERNYAVLRSKLSRFGVMQPMPRTQEEIEVIAKSEREILGADVRASILNTVKADVVAALEDKQCSSITDEKEHQNALNETVIGQKLPIIEKVDTRHFCNLGKPFFDDAIPHAIPLSDIGIPQADDAIPEQANIEVWLKIADTVGGIATSEILNALGLPIERTNEMEVCHIMTSLGYTKARKAVRGLPRQTVWLKD